mmetsp:Transcript_10591/g.11645  ORF Transcript_10591/g.11645 Transcript_10591/m.11645 type:complete len:147 (-) Transcript_10591:120-560(-)
MIQTAKDVIAEFNIDLEVYEFHGKKEGENPEKLASLFRRSKIVSGPHGGQWAYSILAPADACFIEFAVEGAYDKFKTWWYAGWGTGIGGRNDWYAAPLYGGDKRTTARPADLRFAMANCLGVKIKENYTCQYLQENKLPLKSNKST